MTRKPSKVATERVFSPVFIVLLQLALINVFISCSNRKTLVIKVYCYPEVLFNCHILALIEANDLKEVPF